jgi:hypothetical protein
MCIGEVCIGKRMRKLTCIGEVMYWLKYKTLHEEERKERQNCGRTSSLIYINPPLLI